MDITGFLSNLNYEENLKILQDYVQNDVPDNDDTKIIIEKVLKVDIQFKKYSTCILGRLLKHIPQCCVEAVYEYFLMIGCHSYLYYSTLLILLL